MSQPSVDQQPDALPDDVPTLQALMQELRALVREQQCHLTALQAQVLELTERQNWNSGNFSRPPSSDPP